MGCSGAGWIKAGLLVCAIAAILFTSAVASAATLTDADELGRFGSEGEGAGQLQFPEGSAADPVTGHLYVTAFLQRRINEFTPWGEFVKAFGWDVAPGAVNETQEVRVRAGAGSFKLSFGASTTADLPFDASAAEVQSALNSLVSIGGAGGSVAVTEQLGNPSAATPFIYVVVFKGSLVGTNVAQLTVADGAAPLSAGNPKTELEVRTRADGTPGGAGLESCTEESGCQKGGEGSEGTGQIRFVSSLAVDADSGLYVAEQSDSNGNRLRVLKFSPDGRFLLTFGGDTITDGAAGTGTVSPGSTAITSVVTTEKVFRIGQLIEGTGIEAGTKIAALGNGTITLSAPAGPSATGTPTALSVKAGSNNVPSNEKQTVKLGANTTGGSFTLSFSTPEPSPSSATTAAIAYNATALEVEERLAALANVGAGNLAVTGPAGGPWTVEFKGARYTDTDVERLKANATGLAVSGGEKTAAVTSVKGAEVCHIAAECQAPERGDGPGQFSGGPTVTVAPGGGTLVSSDNRVQRFNAEGEYQSQLELPERVGAFAVDPSSGDLYVTFPGEVEQAFEKVKVRRLDPTGKELDSFEMRRPSRLATDPDGDVFVIQGASSVSNQEEQLEPQHAARVLEFDPKGELVSTFAEAELIPGVVFGDKNWRLEGLSTNTLGDLYVSNHESSGKKGAFIRSFGPGPVSFESPPLRAPQIAAQFAASVGPGEAELRARINPRFWNDTAYHIEYGTAPCGEGSCAETADVNLSKKVFGTPFTSPGVFLEGLEPSTIYHYRFVAKSTGGGPVYGVDPDGEGPKAASFAEGLERTFTTARVPAEQSCPENEAFRIGPAAALPDCRAYEMVSPLDKEGTDVVPRMEAITAVPATFDQSSVDGGRLAYGSYGAFAGAEAAPFASEYVATRTEGEGWATHSINPPKGKTVVFSAIETGDTEFKAFSPDLCEAWVQPFSEVPPAVGAPEGVRNLYRRTDEECGGPGFEPLNTVEPPMLHGQLSGESFKVNLQGLSADGTTAVFLANDKLAEGGSLGIPTAQGGNKGPTQLYAAEGGVERFLCVLPSGNAWPGSCTAGGSDYDLPSLDRFANVAGAVSEDGQRVFWTATPEGPGPIYLRENPVQPQSALAHGSASGTGKLTEGSTLITSLIAARSKASLELGSPIATLLEAPNVGEFVAGQPLNTTTGIPAGTTIVSCSPKCGSAAETLTLSTNATATSASVTLTSRGPMPFTVGQTISAPGIPPETAITEVKAGELKISKAATVTESNVPLTATSECTEPAKACTVAVSQQAENENKASGSQYWAASEDGSVALFSTANKLYEFRLADRSTHLIASGGVARLGTSKDASRIYLSSGAVLSGTNAEGKSPVGGQSNLYFYEAGQFHFIGVLELKGILLSPTAAAPIEHTSRVSPDGLHAAFMATSPMTDYDNTDVASEEPDAEVYLYDAMANGGEGRLVCASCNPSGARPQGILASEEQYGTVWAAARIPAYENNLYASRVLSEDGSRLFFESYDPLVPHDTNGQRDVYQWEASGVGTCEESSPSYSPLNEGCVDLISTGKSSKESIFVDASPDGHDVFFRTLSSLVSQDFGLVDIYDARVNGGLPSSQPPPASCEGEACQSAPEAPNDPTPASSSFEGAGNVKEAPVLRKPCAKGKVRRQGKCVAKKHKRARKRAKHHRRAAR